MTETQAAVDPGSRPAHLASGSKSSPAPALASPSASLLCCPRDALCFVTSVQPDAVSARSHGKLLRGGRRALSPNITSAH